MGNSISGGGEGGYFGGDEPAKTGEKTALAALREFVGSRRAKMRESVLRSIASSLKSQDLIQDEIEGKDARQLAELILGVLPKPGEAWGNSPEKQKLVCQQIAKEFNKHGKVPLFPTTDITPKDLCRRVTEFVKSMATGFCVEFLEVMGGVRKSLTELHAYRDLMRKMHRDEIEALKASADAGAIKQSEVAAQAYHVLDGEIDRLIKELEGYYSTTLGPAEEEMTLLMAEGSSILDRLDKKLSAKDLHFGRVISETMRDGLGTLTHSALKTLDALSAMGKKADDFATLQADAVKTWAAAAPPGDPKEVEKRAAALETLLSVFNDREAVDKAIKSLPKAVRERDGVEGGAPERKTELEKRIEKAKKLREVVLNQYLVRSQQSYEKLLAAIARIGPKLGGEIPVTDALLELRDAFERLNNFDMPRVDLSLVGFFQSADARARRQSFLDHLRHIERVAGDLARAEAYQAHASYFEAIREAIAELIQTIDYYADYVAKKDGAGDGAGDGAADAELTADDVTGGDEVDVSSLGLAQRHRSSLDLQSAINDFIYYFYVARVRSNLKTSAQEIQTYGEKYERVLGDAVASRIQAIDDEERELFKEGQAPDATHLGPCPTVPAENDPNYDAAKAAADEWKAAKEALKEQYAVKRDFYRVLQAVDLYMKAFTLDVARNPDAVKDIRALLSGIENIANWFNEETGDDLTRFFDTTQAYGQDAPADVKLIDDHHYYESVRAAIQETGAVPVGTGGAFPATQYKDVTRHAGAVVNNYQALRNLMNVFARLGLRLGGDSLASEVFMTPTDMYKALVRFLKVSSVSVRLNRAPGGVAAGARSPANLAGQNVNQAPAPNAGVQINNAPENDEAVAARRCYVTPAAYAGNGVLENRWKVENQFFQFVVKCIAAKTLVVLGVFDMFERPEPLYELTATRMIIGGYDKAVEVIPEAVELYFRLPRLAEYYADLFKFSDNDAQRISMLPEAEGTFGPLVAQVFVRSTAAAKTGEYSDLEAEELVRIVNAIYDRYRSHGADAVRRVVTDFVAEINRRYGLVKKVEYDRLRKLQQETRTQYQTSSVVDTNYAILPGEEEVGEGVRRLAPSDRYRRVGDAGAALAPDWEAGEYSLDADINQANSMWNMLASFRENLTTSLSQKGMVGRASFKTLVDQARRDVERESDAQKRLEIVYRLIQGSDLIVGSDRGRALMFQETVVVASNILVAIHDQMAAFRQRVDDMDLEKLTEETVNWLSAANGGPANAAAVTPDNLRAWLTTKGFRAEAVNRYVRGNGTTRLTTIFPEPLIPDQSPRNLADLWTWAANSAEAVAGAGVAPADDLTARRALAARLLIDRQAVMRDLVLTAFELTADYSDYVTLRFPGSAASKIHLDFSKLRGEVETLITEMRKFLNVFRPLMAADTVRRFESGDVPGSLFWCEKHLIDGMFKGFTDQGGAAYRSSTTLEAVSARFNRTLVELTRRHAVMFAGFTAGGAFADATGAAAAAGSQLTAVATDAAMYDQYGRVFAGLIFWDVGDMPAIAGRPLNGAPLGAFVRGARTIAERANEENPPLKDTQAIPGAAGAPPAPANIINGNDIYANRGFTNNRSMLFMFNQVLAMYMRQNYDASTGKIYFGLIDAFANGVFSQAVMQPGYSQPDLTSDGAAFGTRGDPTGGSVLLTSLATVLQRWVKDQTAQGVSRYLVSTLSELPLYVKEAFRENLPVFQKLFDLIGKQGEFLKQFIERTRVQCGRPSLTTVINAPAGAAVVAVGDIALVGAAGVAAAPPTWPAGSVVPDVTLRTFGDAAKGKSETVIPRLTEVVDALVSGAYALSGAAQSVLRELADEPLYLQTSANSIQDYTARNKKMPLMPLSLAFYYLRDVDNAGAFGADQATTVPGLLPEHAPGSQEFKLLYGVRGLFAPEQRATLASMPGVRELLVQYNAGSSAQGAVEEEAFAAFAGRVAGVLRYLVDTRGYRTSLVAGGHTFGAAHLFGAAGAAGAAAALVPDNMRVYALRPPTTRTQVLEVVDTTYQEEKMGAMTRDFETAGGAGADATGANRAQEWIRNIIDLNLMPINVHALMRTMALANLYNYGYTFEEMVCRFYQKERGAIAALNTANGYNGQDNPKTTVDFFLKLLIDPYASVSAEQYGFENMLYGTAGYVQRMCRGDNALVMGRPKFLSDQVFNKVLFGSLYPRQRDHDEMGTSGETTRGRQAWQAFPNDMTINQSLSNARTILKAFADGGRLWNIPRGGGIVRANNTPTTMAITLAMYNDNMTTLENALPAGGAAAVAVNAAYALLGGANIAKFRLIGLPAPGAGNAVAFLAAAAAAPTMAIVDNGNYAGNGLLGGAALIDYRAFLIIFGATNEEVDATAPANVIEAAKLVQKQLVKRITPLLKAAEDAVRSLVVERRTQGQRPGGVDPSYDEVITYIGKKEVGQPDFTAVKEVSLKIDPRSLGAAAPAQSVKPALLAVGKQRFDSAFVRNLFLITNVFRITRAKLERELSDQRTIIERGDRLVSREMTEYGEVPALGPDERHGDRQFSSERTMM